MAMNNNISRKQYIAETKNLYGEACRCKDKKRKTQILDDAVAITGLQRKYLIAVFRTRRKVYPTGFAKADGSAQTSFRGRKARYGSTEFLNALLVCWRATNCSCAENLQPYLPELVPRLEALGELVVNDETRTLLFQTSVSTIARKLKKHKRKDHIPLSTTRPGKLIKAQVAIRRGRWDETEPGSLETDTVAHCGDANEGLYIHSYNFVDIATSWSEQVAVMGIGERATIQALDDVAARLPFAIRAIDSDNGSEFLNWHLHGYCKDHGIDLTRSRPYKKNDNAHIEQKNNTAIRKMVGYGRYDTAEQLALLNRLYNGPLRLYLNYCQPTRKRRAKTIDKKTNKTSKTFFEAKTPYQRMMKVSNKVIPGDQKEVLQSTYNNLNPVKLLAEIQAIIDQLDKTLR